MTASAGPQRRLEAHGVLGVPPPVADQGPGVVVDEREQVGLAAADHRAVQGVAGPQVTRRQRLEAARTPAAGARRDGC